MYDFASVREKVLSEYEKLGSERAVADQYQVNGKPLNQYYINAIRNGKRVPKHILKVVGYQARLGKPLPTETKNDLLARLHGRSDMPPINPEMRAALERL